MYSAHPHTIQSLRRGLPSIDRLGALPTIPRLPLLSILSICRVLQKRHSCEPSKCKSLDVRAIYGIEIYRPLSYGDVVMSDSRPRTALAASVN